MRTQTPHTLIAAGEHVVQFYDHDRELARAVGGYLAQAVRDQAAAVVVATPAHRELFEGELAAAGIDVTRARLENTLVVLDAAATMERFMPSGELDPVAFRAVIGGVIRGAGQGGREVRAYGEMVSLLWDAGEVLAAIELERLWNELGRELAFSLWCAYHSRTLAVPERAEALHEVCHLHSAVVDEATAHFAADADTPAAARRFVTSVLARAPYRDGSFLSDAQLVVSELSTNAVMHAATPYSVSVDCTGSDLRISIRDWSLVTPRLRDSPPSALSGRGLRILDALAHRWGVEHHADGKTVWAELPLR